MRTLMKISVIMSALLLLASCAVTPSITVTPSTISVKAAGEKVKVAVDANCEWTPKSDQSWASARKNEDDGSLTVSVNRNNVLDSRTAVITLTAEGASATVTVNQEQKNSVIIDGEYLLTVDEKAQEATLGLQANTDYKVTVTKGSDWAHFGSITKGMVASKAVFRVDANDSYEKRDAEITVEAPECSKLNAKIFQYGKSRSLSLEVAGVEKFTVPTVRNDESWASVTVAGTTVDYAPGMAVDVDKAGAKVDVKCYQLKSVQLEDVVGVKGVDLTKLF